MTARTPLQQDHELDDIDDDNDCCTWCGGDGTQENDDPLWHGFHKHLIDCESCNGTGLRKYQTVF